MSCTLYDFFFILKRKEKRVRLRTCQDPPKLNSLHTPRPYQTPIASPQPTHPPHNAQSVFQFLSCKWAFLAALNIVCLLVRRRREEEEGEGRLHVVHLHYTVLQQVLKYLPTLILPTSLNRSYNYLYARKENSRLLPND